MELIIAVAVLVVIFLVIQGGKFTNFKSSLMNEFGRNGIPFKEADRLYTQYRNTIHALHNAGMSVPEIVNTVRNEINTSPSNTKLVPNITESKQQSKSMNVDVIMTINETIAMQLLLSPKKEIDSDDEFAVGYLIGYTDAVMQKLNIDNNSPEGFGTLTAVIINFFGEDVGAKLVRDFLNNQINLSSQFKSGMMAGGRDVFAWLGAEKKVTPSGLSRHNFEKYGDNLKPEN